MFGAVFPWAWYDIYWQQPITFDVWLMISQVHGLKEPTHMLENLKVLCIHKSIHSSNHTHTHTRTHNARTHARTHAHTQCMHAHTCTHARTQVYRLDWHHSIANMILCCCYCPRPVLGAWHQFPLPPLGLMPSAMVRKAATRACTVYLMQHKRKITFHRHGMEYSMMELHFTLYVSSRIFA